MGFNRELCAKDTDRMANNVVPDQTAPSLCAQTCLYENLGSVCLQQVQIKYTRIRPVLVKNMIILASYVNKWTFI